MDDLRQQDRCPRPYNLKRDGKSNGLLVLISESAASASKRTGLDEACNELMPVFGVKPTVRPRMR